MPTERPTLHTTIAHHLFLRDDTRLVVVENPDGFLLREDVRWELSYLHIVVEQGTSLDLRILFETRYKSDCDVRFVFVKSGAFDVLPDIAAVAEQTSFVVKRIFKHYKWDVLKNATLPTLEWFLSKRFYTNLSERETADMVHEYEASYASKLEKISTVERDWRNLFSQTIDFNRPTRWMPAAAQLLRRALAIDQWAKMSDEVENLNNGFQSFLKHKYINIVSSSVPPKDQAPRVVTQVLPFMAKQDAERTALIVVDGMNYWQAAMLADEIVERLHVDVKYDCIYSWLPSVTELSRQAIFRGDTPATDYAQNPHNEERLWRDFWKARHLTDHALYYQYDGALELSDYVTRVAYVTVGLDKLMHSSNNFRYLYRSTQLWLQEDELIDNIKFLKAKGFKIFITTDHGNVEVEPLRILSSSEKVGTMRSLRHITLSPYANADLFKSEWGDTVISIDGFERTFYPRDRYAFASKAETVTHGGTHWLEVLIPFLTIQ